MAKTILILGASYVGLTVTHKLLKHTLKNKKGEYKVILVSPTTHHYWNLASVRAIVPGILPDEKIFASIPDGLAKYGDAIEFVHGTANQFDPTSKTVTITSKTGIERKQAYDILVISTGARTKDDIPWKSSLAGYEATRDSLHQLQKEVKAAQSIVLGGAGPTGVESAGELGFEFGKTKEITLITAGPQLLNDVPASVAKQAETELQRMKVAITYNTKVTSSTKLPDGKTELTLSTGEKKIVDLYLPTIGTVPNTDFIPKTLLNEKTGEVKVDEFLRVKDAPEVWAAGDVSDIQPSQFVYAEKQAAALAKNLDLTINGKQPVRYDASGAPVLGVSLGRSKGTGRMGNNKLPSLVIWFVKGRTLGTQNLQGLVSGSSA